MGATQGKKTIVMTGQGLVLTFILSYHRTRLAMNVRNVADRMLHALTCGSVNDMISLEGIDDYGVP